MAALDLVVAGGNYSYTANTEYHGNNLNLPYSEATRHLASAGFTHTCECEAAAAKFTRPRGPGPGSAPTQSGPGCRYFLAPLALCMSL
eukprot:SAG22_NODE_11_length_35583_cov_107.128790_15_plen_88_part_00